MVGDCNTARRAGFLQVRRNIDNLCEVDRVYAVALGCYGAMVDSGAQDNRLTDPVAVLIEFREARLHHSGGLKRLLRRIKGSRHAIACCTVDHSVKLVNGSFDECVVFGKREFHGQ